MRSYTVTPLRTEVPAWEEIPALQVDNVLWLPDSGVRMTQQLCYDAKYLYVRQQAWEQRIRAQRTGYLQQVCEDSCMEFFFAPLGEDRYFNLEINPNGCIRLGFGPAVGLRTQLVVPDMEQLFSVEARRTEDGWTLTYAIPLTFIQLFYPDFCFCPGTVLRGNCYKCGDLTDHPHYLSWNEVQSDTPSFHRPQDFGLLIFG
jgi:hypothetical protein